MNEINCPPRDLDGISVGDRVSFRWEGHPRRFGVVRHIMPFGSNIRYTVKVDGAVHLYDVWSFDITKEVG